MNTSTSHLIIGASSAIAQAAIDQLLVNHQTVVAISRNSAPIIHDNLTWIVYEPSEESIAGICAVLSQKNLSFSWVGIFLGQLHTESMQPEKRLEDFNPIHFSSVMSINSVLPLLWIKHLMPIITGANKALDKCVISACSARVGSINDNQLGGWYSYRASKAALNMLLKNISIELARRAPNTKLLSFHPGTTDSALSKPFQARVPKDKLFTPKFVAQRLINIIDQLKPDGQLSYLDWDNKPIEF